MKNLIKILLTTLLYLVNMFNVHACHSTDLTLISGPTPIGGNQYQTTIQVCFGQYTAGNWGGTMNFNLTLAGATYVSFSPATITNNYFAYTGASCSGPNCFMNTCTAVSATAAGSIINPNTVQYNTTSSTPAGYPIVPDDAESCAGCPTLFCFNFTFVSNGYPTSISLNGNVELLRPRVCVGTCGFPNTYAGGPCNGSYDAGMTIIFAPLPIELLYFNGHNNNIFNLLEWSSATETNNDYYTIEKSVDAVNWDIVSVIKGAGNSSMPLRYTYHDVSIKSQINYYRLKQTDFNGKFKYHSIIAIDNTPIREPKIIKLINHLGQDVNENSTGLLIEIYDNGTTKKIIKQ